MKHFNTSDFYTQFMFVNKFDRNGDEMNKHNLRLRRKSAEERRSRSFVNSTRCKNANLLK
jgi:hypothetical protein